MLSAFSSSTRRGIRKAEREGVTVQVDTSLDALRAFTKLNALTRREHGLPPQPAKFFANLHRHILTQGKGVIATAFHQGRAIAASIFLHFGESALFKYGASDKSHQHLRPSNLVMWHGIQWYAERGFPSLHLGRTAMHNEGLRRFKCGWGASEQELSYYRYDLRAGNYVTAPPDKGAPGSEFFQKAPLMLSRLAGALLYRHAA